MKFILTLALSLGLYSQGVPATSPVTGPVVQSLTPFGLQFAAAYYAAQNPAKAPLYNQRYGGPSAPMLTQDQTTTLITQLLAQGVGIDEQIDYWGWDPYTTMAGRLTQGILWVPSGLGNANCSSILQSGCVITPGEYSGTAPAGSIKSSISLGDYPAWVSPVSPVTPVSVQVGFQAIGPYYQNLVKPTPPVGTTATGPLPLGTKSCVMAGIPNQFVIGGGGLMYVWNCQ